MRMPTTRVLILAFAALCVAAAAVAQTRANPRMQVQRGIVIRVLDEGGLVLPNAEVMLMYLEADGMRARGVRGTPGAGGAITVGPDFQLNQPGQRIIAHAYAPGYASQRWETTWTGADQMHEFRLSPGRTVDLVVNAPWAEDGLPDTLWISGAIDEGKQVAINHAFGLDPEPTYNWTPLRPTGPGTFRFQIAEDFDRDLYFLVHHDGFLRFHQAGPVSQTDLRRGFVSIDLPEPTHIDLEFGPHTMESTDPGGFTGAGVVLTINTDARYDGTRFSLAHSTAVDFDDIEFREPLRHLSPGRYNLQFFLRTAEGQRRVVGGPQEARVSRARPGVVRQRFDDTIAQGDYSVAINVRNAANRPAGGMEFQVSTRRQGRNVVVESGTVPENGRIALTGLVGGEGAQPYLLVVDGNRLGSIDLSTGARSRTLTVRLPPRAGDRAPEITLTRLDDNSSLTLSSLRGQIVLVDFWAAWCGPCQAPMAKMEEIMARRGEDWKGRAVILGVNIDERREAAESHLQSRGWDRVLHGWSHADGLGFRSAAPRDYGVTGIPTALLIDPEGNIAWRGHPASIDKEAEIDNLLEKWNL